MSESDSCIPGKVAALAEALETVRKLIGVGSGLYRPFLNWFRANTPNTKPSSRDARERLISCRKAAVEFVEAVDMAHRTLNALPVSVLKPLSALIDGVPWDVRTRRTLRAIQYEASFLKSLSMDPSMLDLLLSSMGKDGFQQRQSKLLGFRAELTERLLDLNSLPPDLSEMTGSVPSQRRPHQSSATNPNEKIQGDGGPVVPALHTENSNKTDDKLPKKLRRDSPSRLKAKAAYDYAMQQIPNAHAMTAVELFDAIMEDGDAKEMLPPTAESFIKYLNDCGIRLRKGDPKPTSSSVVRRSDT